jgi:hypothetical protein
VLVKANWFDPVFVPRHETPSGLSLLFRNSVASYLKARIGVGLRVVGDFT